MTPDERKAWLDLAIAIRQALPKRYADKVLELLALWCLIHYTEKGQFDP